MGGRGSSSGVGDKSYGTEFHTVYQSRNIKFVKYNDGSAKAPMETMTNGRIYVTVNDKDALKSISYYDKDGKRYKQIDLTSPHKIGGVDTMPHTHIGYYHSENGLRQLSEKEKKMVERVTKIWRNRK
jgi:hypothetical protein